ncbi:MAG: hypothetical protein KBC33_00050 [Candidatus Pacebacteria bacterium]|nr:hypothetical protein [Candidatus Paceibacterota bacterium]
MKTLSVIEMSDLRRGIVPVGTRQGHVVPLAALLARKATDQELTDEHLGKLHMISARLSNERVQLLPVEQELNVKLATRALLVRQEIARIRTAQEYDNLPVIDGSFLGWKTMRGFPAFSVYDVNSPDCRITYTSGFGREHVSVTPDMHFTLRSHYIDATLKAYLAQMCEEQRLSSVSLTARYGGAMPSEVREKIHKFIPVFEAVYIVAEAPNWTVNRIAAIPIGDPLVIGVTKLNTLCLIAKYDLTSTEQLAHDLCADPSQHRDN